MIANVQGWEKCPVSGDVNKINYTTDMNEHEHECPIHGKVYAVKGNEGIIMANRDRAGQERAIMAAGDGGLGIQHQPGDAVPKMGMYVNGGGALMDRAPGRQPTGVALKLNGNLLADPNRDLFHMESDFDNGQIGGDRSLY